MRLPSSVPRESILARSLLLCVLYLVTAFWLAHAVPATASAKPTDEQIVKDLGPYLDRLAAKDTFSGAVLLAKGDKVLFKGAYGYANRAFNAPNKVDTKFNFGSMGKMFTAVAILQLVEQGKLSLDDKLIKIVPDYPDQDIAQKITIYQLLTHTSGLGNMFNQKFEDMPKNKLDTIEAHLPLFVGSPLQFEPGSKFSYSNAGFIVLGLVIERVSGESYYDYVREHIFRPAGMINTDNFEPHEDVPNLALGYTMARSPGSPPPNVAAGRPTLRRINNDFIHRGASSGGGYSTVEDLLRFSRSLQAYKLLNRKHTDLLMAGKVSMDMGDGKYGFGMIESFVNGVRIVGHSGGAPGINSKLDMYPDLGYTVVVMSNYDGGTRPVIDRLQLELTGQGLPRVSDMSAEALKVFAGTYAPVAPPAGAPPGMRMPPMTITADEKGLLLNTGMGPSRRFVPLSAEEFFDEDSPGVRLRFAKGEKGQIASVTARGVAPGPAITATRLP